MGPSVGKCIRKRTLANVVLIQARRPCILTNHWHVLEELIGDLLLGNCDLLGAQELLFVLLNKSLRVKERVCLSFFLLCRQSLAVGTELMRQLLVLLRGGETWRQT